VKHYAERVGLDPAAYAGHCSGFLTSAAEAGASALSTPMALHFWLVCGV
jgi:hypothetical protein